MPGPDFCFIFAPYGYDDQKSSFREVSQLVSRALTANKLRECLTFQKRAIVSDDYGNTEGNWVDQFTCAAEIKPRLGGETVLQERLAGRQPYMLTVRYSSNSAQITPEWRAFDARKGVNGAGEPVRLFNIRTVANPDMKRRFVEMLVDEGVNT